MKKQQVDTPYKNSWADEMRQRKPQSLFLNVKQLDPIFQNQQRLMNAQKILGTAGATKKDVDYANAAARKMET